MGTRDETQGPLDAMRSPRFGQVATFARLPLVADLAEVDVAFLGVPFDCGTTFRPGARFGPSGIRENSRLLRPYNMSLDVRPFDVFNVADLGDVDVVPTSFEATCIAVGHRLEELLTRGVRPLICGGDHSITLPVLRELRRVHGAVNLIHFDSHFDFWDVYWDTERYTHGTWLRRALEEGLVGAVAQVGIRGPQFSAQDRRFADESNISVETIGGFHRDGVDAVMQRVLAWLPKEKPLYVSWDIDVVDPAFAAATGTPEVGGMTSWEALECVRALVGHQLVGFDVVEVAPIYDGPGAVTCLLAANLLFEALSVMAVDASNGPRQLAAGEALRISSTNPA